MPTAHPQSKLKLCLIKQSRSKHSNFSVKWCHLNGSRVKLMQRPIKVWPSGLFTLGPRSAAECTSDFVVLVVESLPKIGPIARG